jgi:probable rRNA maturation factor
MPLTILNRQRKIAVDVAALRPRLDAAVAAAVKEDADVTLVLVSDAAIRKLNRDWRDVDRPTDVLSFPAHEGEGAEFAGEELGDIVISLETAKAQGPIHVPGGAPEQAFEDEVVFLFVHGLCHLLGHDHNEAGETRRMKALEKKILGKVAATPMG